MNRHIDLGPLMLDIEGTELTKQESELLQKPSVGGIILFSRNYESPTQLNKLIQQIRDAAPYIIIAVDQEGGRVQRMKEGFTRLPPMKVFGDMYKTAPEATLKLAKDTGWLLAAELISHDIDISFTPVLDIDFEQSKVIGDRAFSSDPSDIVILAKEFIFGMKEAGMASTGKHYPGHGFVAADSHFEIPIDNRKYSAIEENDLSVFAQLASAGLDAVMPAHVIYPDVDHVPAGFSSRWLKEILRKELSFDGVIFSDDLGMEGASVAGDYIERTKAALEAGCDMVLVCNKPDAAKQVLDFLESQPKIKCGRLSKMKYDSTKRFSPEELQCNERWLKTRESLSALLTQDKPTAPIGE